MAAGAGFQSSVSSVYHWMAFSVAFPPRTCWKPESELCISIVRIATSLYFGRITIGSLPDGGTGPLSYLPISELTALLYLIDGLASVGLLEMLSSRSPCTD